MQIQTASSAVDARADFAANGFLSMTGTFQTSDQLSGIRPDDLVAVAFADLEPKPARHTVYNFEVEGTHTYIAGGYRVHNRSALSYFDPEKNGLITDIYNDGAGRLVVESVDEQGGKWKINTAEAVNTATGTTTTAVTKEYEYGVLDENGERDSRFYVSQTETWEGEGTSEERLTGVTINENYWLFGDETGGQLSDALTPFILTAVGSDSAFERLATGTLVDTLLQNILEGGLNFVHHSFLNGSTNGDVFEQLVIGAFDDFGLDLALNGIDNSISFASQLIMAEIFSGADIDTLPEEVMQALVQDGVDYVLSVGVDNFIDTILGEGSKLGEAFDPGKLAITDGAAFTSLVFSVALNEVIPQPETLEGSIASSFAKILTSGAFSTLGPILPILGPAVIGFIVGKLFDSIFDKDPEAFAGLTFDPAKGIWTIDYIDENDGGSKEFAKSLGQAVSNGVEQFQIALQATSHNYDEISTLEIGHHEDKVRNGDGRSYDMDDPKAVFGAITAIVKQIRPTDGDLRVARALGFETIEEDLTGLDPEEAYSYLYSRLRIALDYKFYLENSEQINLLILTAPDSAEAKAWLATILAASDMGLADAYQVIGDATDNLVLTADSADIVDGAGGDDEIFTFGGNDQIKGGDGEDYLVGGAGADAIDGGTGIDTIGFDHTTRGVELDLSEGAGTGGDAEGDTYTSIENVIGSLQADHIIGSQTVNAIQGNVGDDIIEGHAGDDVLHGNEGDDTLYGDLADDVTTIGNDQLFGGAGDDLLFGGRGIDTYNGGDGRDRVSFALEDYGVVASLEENQVKINSLRETFTSIEGVVGSRFNDILTGDADANSLEGGKGNDVLAGGRGLDTYYYSLGDGNDVIYDSVDGAQDKLVFRDITSDQVSFDKLGFTLLIRIENGDTIKIDKQFTGDSAILYFEFADGVSYDAEELHNRMVADQANGGSDVGPPTFQDTSYIHRLGDGSYHIKENYSPGTTDISLLDVEPHEVRLERSGDDLRIVLPNGEAITVINQFWIDEDLKIDIIRFKNGDELSKEDIEAKALDIASDLANKIGTGASETYSHSVGDGSYVISDYSFWGDPDSLVFEDLTAEEISLSRSGDDVIIQTSTGEQITIINHMNGQFAIENWSFSDGEEWTPQEIRDRLVSDVKGRLEIVGTSAGENYVHRQGDGSYTITDYDWHIGLYHQDSLTFEDVSSADVNMSRSVSNIIFTLPNGEKITVTNQLNGRYVIEEVSFSDGVSWSNQDIVQRLVADGENSGIIQGTGLNETYRHDLEDGPKMILDGGGTDDRLFLESFTVDEVQFLNVGGDDLQIVLPNGHSITVLDHLGISGAHAIETITFANAVELDLQAIRDKAANDAKPYGAVSGTERTENYVYESSDGSVTITDFDLYGKSGTDSLTFADLGATDLSFANDGAGTLIITTPFGETVTVVDHFLRGSQFAIEEMRFADGTALDLQGIRDKTVADMKSMDVIVGTEHAENYTYLTGDGSWVISDFDRHSNDGTDTLFFEDLMPEEIIFRNNGDDTLQIVTESGDTVSILGQLERHSWTRIEEISFADGTILDLQAIRDKVVADARDTGFVTGTEHAENYVHTSGDGSYRITDYDPYANNGTDTLTFADLRTDEVSFSEGNGGSLVISTSAGETIEIEKQLGTNTSYRIEEINFASGETLNLDGMRSKLADDTAVDGTGGNDTISDGYSDQEGHAINDLGQVIYGHGGTDKIYDGAGDDLVYGGSGNDQFYAGEGTNEFQGETGSDRVSYQRSEVGLTVDLTDTANSTGRAQGDIYSSVEWIHGSNHDDIIVASSEISNIHGQKGNDVLVDGATRNDFIGGDGYDVFRFEFNDGHRDRIRDFKQGVDKIDLSAAGVSSFSELSITENVDSDGIPQGHLLIAYGSETLRVDRYDAADIGLFDEMDFIFAEPMQAQATAASSDEMTGKVLINRDLPSDKWVLPEGGLKVLVSRDLPRWDIDQESDVMKTSGEQPDQSAVIYCDGFHSLFEVVADELTGLGSAKQRVVDISFASDFFVGELDVFDFRTQGLRLSSSSDRSDMSEVLAMILDDERFNLVSQSPYHSKETYDFPENELAADSFDFL